MSKTKFQTPLTQEELERLRLLAEKATPGPWRLGYGCSENSQTPIFASVVLKRGKRKLGLCMGRLELREDAAYIAGISPGVILALIARIEELEAKLEIAVEDTLSTAFLNIMSKLPQSLKDKIANLTGENERLEKEADWLSEQLLCCTDDNRVDTCQYVSCRHLCANTTVQGWRKAAREAVKDN